MELPPFLHAEPARTRVGMANDAYWCWVLNDPGILISIAGKVEPSWSCCGWPQFDPADTAQLEGFLGIHRFIVGLGHPRSYPPGWGWLGQ